MKTMSHDFLVQMAYFTRTATESVRRLSDQFPQAQDHILLKNRLKIKEITNSASENLNRKDTTEPMVSMHNFPIRQQI